jgi:hypothetical protein
LLDALEVLLGALLNTGRSHPDRLPSTLPRPTPKPPRRPDLGFE